MNDQSEGILGIIFEEHEKTENFEFFFKRYLDYCLKFSDDKVMEDLFLNKMYNYIKLNQIFTKVELENISEILLLGEMIKISNLAC